MREIKFRGKHFCSKEWCYGSLINYKEDSASILAYDSEKNMVSHDIVIPETIGQYTGLKDKNGVEVYEGDKINDSDLGLGFIIFVKGCFMIEWEDCDCYRDLLAWDDFNRCLERDMNRIEVIGNIHENDQMHK